MWGGRDTPPYGRKGEKRVRSGVVCVFDRHDLLILGASVEGGLASVPPRVARRGGVVVVAVEGAVSISREEEVTRTGEG